MKGAYIIEIISASPAQMLNALANLGVVLHDVYEIDGLTIRARVSNSQFDSLKKVLKKRGERCILVERLGIYWRIANLIRRPILLGVILILFVITWILPSKVVFVGVEGNVNVPAEKILSVAESCGIHIGASRAEVRSEKVKNKLLISLPQLKWACINTKGCTATISVMEREPNPENQTMKHPQCVVAHLDGKITEMTVTKGTPMCQVGDVVNEGQILISPYIDTETSAKYTGAEGEIMAETQREISAIMVYPDAYEDNMTDGGISISLLFGKNKINLYKDSGNYTGVCDKIYKEMYLTLPGGFCLPVAIVAEQIICRELVSEKSMPQAQQRLESGVEKYLERQMVSGRILSQNAEFQNINKALILRGNYSCVEMIGKLETEEIVPNG